MRLLSLLLVSFLVAACVAGKKPLAGKRISVFDLQDKLSVASSASLKWSAPAVRSNHSWPQFGGSAHHAPQHLAVDGFDELWRIKAGALGVAPLQVPPIVAGGRIFVLDGRAELHVFDAKTGARLWRHKFALTGDKGARSEWSRLGFGGGLAFARGRVFVATGFGTAVAINANSGKEIWRHEMRIPFRAAPIVAGGQVYFLSFNNRLSARDVLSGREIWSHQGISESGSLLVSSAVAVSQQIVIAPYNSGEIYALRARDKGFVWNDNLSGQSAISSPADDRFIAVPAVDRNRVYVVSHVGNMAAINLVNGERLWSQSIASVNMPWVAGDRVFVLARGGLLLALSAERGGVIWRRKLPSSDISEPVIWHGPILAGGVLLLTSSDGRLARVDPKSGRMRTAAKFAQGFTIAPIIAARRAFLLSKDMELIALGSKGSK